MTYFRAGLLAMALLVGACSVYRGQDGPPTFVPDGPLPDDPVPRVEPRSRYGNPASYEVLGRRYHVMASGRGYRERGIASWYGTKFHGQRTSSGEIYDMHDMTAAHRSLPLPSYVHVTNLRNGARAIVRVNDRGPFHDNRIIDLSYSAARKLGIIGEGTGLVEVRYIDPEPPAARAVQASVSILPTVDAVASEPPPRIFLQAGAFSDEANAVRLRTRLLSFIELPVDVSRGSGDTTSFHRVRIGPLADVSTADRLTQTIVEAGMALPTIVIE